MGRGVRRFTELRAWQACHAFKLEVYAACAEGPLSRDWPRRRQLEEAAAGPPAHLAEGFGRFNPAEFARFVVIARSSLMESQNHLRDAVDKQYISEATRLELDARAEAALREVTGLMEYLHSADALRNARHARERRVATRLERRGAEPEPELRTPNPNPNPEREHEPSTEK